MILAWSRQKEPPTVKEAYRALFLTQQELARATDSKLARRLELRKALIALHAVNGDLLAVCAQLIQHPSAELCDQADALIAQVTMIRNSLR